MESKLELTLKFFRFIHEELWQRFPLGPLQKEEVKFEESVRSVSLICMKQTEAHTFNVFRSCWILADTFPGRCTVGNTSLGKLSVCDHGKSWGWLTCVHIKTHHGLQVGAPDWLGMGVRLLLLLQLSKSVGRSGVGIVGYVRRLLASSLGCNGSRKKPHKSQLHIVQAQKPGSLWKREIYKGEYTNNIQGVMENDILTQWFLPHSHSSAAGKFHLHETNVS